MKINTQSLPRCAQLAFTLAEAMVGTAILGTMMVSLYGSIASSFALTRVCRENLRATQIMLERTEGLRLYRWDQITDPSFFVTNFTANYYPLGQTNNNNSVVYGGTIKIETPTNLGSATYITNMRLITV